MKLDILKIRDTNLCKEILILADQIQCTLNSVSFDTGVFYAPYIPKNMTKPKYKFSRAKWYVAEYSWMHHDGVIDWCIEQFGPHPNAPDAWSRWHNPYSDQIHFRDERDYIMFVLRWS